MDLRAGSAGRLAPLALILCVGLLYAQTARHAFVDYDTGPYLTANSHVLAGLSLANLRWAFSDFAAANWHPLTWLSHMLDVELFGLAPAGHLLENAAWHAANALLVLALFTRLGLARPYAFAGALCFAIHPLRAESVAWVVERKDLLSTFFGLASLIAWLGWAREGSARRLAAALALYACSLMAKPMFVTLPGLLVLLEFGLLGRTSWRPRRSDLATLGFLVLALGASILTLRAQSAFGTIRGFESWPLALRLENALDAYVWYLARTFWPAPLAFHYPLARDMPLFFDVLLLAAISAGVWLARRRIPALLVGWLWFLGALVPVIGIVQVGAQAHADRYSYFPSLGILFALGSLAERARFPRVLAALGCLAALALGLQSWRQIGTWRDTETLALHALAVTRDNDVACDLLGDYYTNTGRVAQAVPYLREALRLAPDDPNVVANLGGTLLRLGQLAESEQLLLRASRLTPERWQVWSLLGGCYLAQGRAAEALAAFDRALLLEPADAGTQANRGRARAALGLR